MESNNSNYVGIYHTVYKTGVINKNDVKNPTNLSHELSHQNIIPLTRVNQFFFGTNTFSNKLNYLVLHRESMIKKYMGIYWLYVGKLENYLNEVYSVIDMTNNINCCPYNWVRTFGKDHVIHPYYHDMINTIESFLTYLSKKNTPDAKTILNIMSPNSKNMDFKLEAEMVDMIDLGDINKNELLLKFDKKGKPLFLSISWNTNTNIGSNVLHVSKEVNQNQFEKIYEYICEQLRMDEPEEFLINNLDRVCGSREFAEIMVKSYLSKTECIYPLEIVSSIIGWKDSGIQKNYENKFVTKYSHCCENKDTVWLLNFEGINKFLLNITESHVNCFEVKEQINDMYYNCMNELIHSFELLYKNK